MTLYHDAFMAMWVRILLDVIDHAETTKTDPNNYPDYHESRQRLRNMVGGPTVPFKRTKLLDLNETQLDAVQQDITMGR
jgi:hypothetical protein